jgi:hypothetical protein
VVDQKTLNWHPRARIAFGKRESGHTHLDIEALGFGVVRVGAGLVRKRDANMVRHVFDVDPLVWDEQYVAEGAVADRDLQFGICLELLGENSKAASQDFNLAF